MLHVVECKSYLDSSGVKLKAFDGSNKKAAKRYKLFNDDNLKDVIFNRLRAQFLESGACPNNVKVKLCLACAHIAFNDREGLHKHFVKNGWELWDEDWLKKQLKIMSDQGYENQVSSVVAKLLLR